MLPRTTRSTDDDAEESKYDRHTTRNRGGRAFPKLAAVALLVISLLYLVSLCVSIEGPVSHAIRAKFDAGFETADPTPPVIWSGVVVESAAGATIPKQDTGGRAVVKEGNAEGDGERNTRRNQREGNIVANVDGTALDVGAVNPLRQRDAGHGDSGVEVGIPDVPHNREEERKGQARGDYITVNPEVKLPNEREHTEGGEIMIEAGTHSPHYGQIQRERQEWLVKKAQELWRHYGDEGAAAEAAAAAAVAAAAEALSKPHRPQESKTTGARPNQNSQNKQGKGKSEEDQNSLEGRRFVDSSILFAAIDRHEKGKNGNGGKRKMVEETPVRSLALEEGDSSYRDRIQRLEDGVMLWGATYVPAIEAGRRRELIDKWSPPGVKQGDGEHKLAAGGSRGRILFVATSFDRDSTPSGSTTPVDKLDYLLMMMDEMREACEVGFSPHVHLVTAWNSTEANDLIRDRLFCERTGNYVPYSNEEHSPEITSLLSIKHRIFMKSRVEDYDIFIQTADDMIVTLNHILLYLEQSHKLQHRRGRRPNFDMLPGFIRVEPGEGKGKKGAGEEWFEWDVLYSRFEGTYVNRTGTYITLEVSRDNPSGGNNQDFWIATGEQLRHLAASCGYLDYSEETTRADHETHGGGLEMFQKCGITKVFPAAEIEGFLVHHRTNSENGMRGESAPAVPISMVRFLAEQLLRDGTRLRNTERRLLEVRR